MCRHVVESLPAESTQRLTGRPVRRHFARTADQRVTIAKVVLEPGAVSPRHRHPSSEQVWVALGGTGLILLANDEAVSFSTGELG